MRSKIFATIISLTFLGISAWIGVDWFWNVVEVMGLMWTILAFTGVVILPALGTSYLSASLLNRDPIIYQIPIDQQPNITVVIACYNEEKTIYNTLESVKLSEYYGHINYIVSDDGSTDGTISEVQRFESQYNINVMTIISDKNYSKAHALNSTLNSIETDIVVTIDADTTLHKEAISRIISQYKSGDFAAVAGAIRLRNSRKNWMTKLQYWDYMFGISSAKQSQAVYGCTLVAQGAFSVFNVNNLRTVGGWKEVVGEDIVLSWDFLKHDMKIGHEKTAIAYTNAPESYMSFFRQRRRWARGLVEAFKQNPTTLIKPGWHLPYVWYNLMFPYIDIAFLFVLIPGILFAIFMNIYVMAGLASLFLIPLGLLMISPIIFRQIRVNKELGINFRLHWITLIVYILTYQLLQPVATLSGYIMEIFNMKKKW